MKTHLVDSSDRFFTENRLSFTENLVITMQLPFGSRKFLRELFDDERTIARYIVAQNIFSFTFYIIFARGTVLHQLN